MTVNTGKGLPAIGLLDIFRSEGTLKLKAIKLLDHSLGWLVASSLPRKKRAAPGLSYGPWRVLLIRPGGLGDAIMLLPIARAVRQAGHQLDILCEQRNCGAFRSQEGLCRKLFRYDKWTEFRAVFKEEYDIVIDTEQWHHLSAVMAYFLKSRRKVGFATRPSRARLFDKGVSYDLAEYELKAFQRLFEDFDLPKELSLKGSFLISDEQARWARDKVDGPYIVLALGGTIPARRFTDRQVEEICRVAFGKGYQVILVGGIDLAAMAQDVIRKMADPRALNFIGQTTLLQTAALIAWAKCFMGHDSGLVHLCAAVGTPMVAVFGPGNKDKWGAQGDQDVLIHLGLACSPCTRFGYTVMTCQGKIPCVRGDLHIEDMCSKIN